MDTRRDFLKKAALLAGATGTLSSIPSSIKRALAINPAVGTTFKDAEHVVLLMQENRSFDHMFGTLQGVRGYNDPRVINLPNGNPAWLQTNKEGRTYGPFPLDIKETKSTWMGSLPHAWVSMVDARNGGRYDNWLEAKKPGGNDYRDMPLTMGYYSRKDLPFYYAMADAFTVCDQHFCSSLTGTTPNRLYFWSGTVREKSDGSSAPNLNNANVTYGSPAHWTTFPERLEEAGVSWKIYQNELSLGVGLGDQEYGWLANFTNNDLEWFDQYHVYFHPAYVRQLERQAKQLKEEISKLDRNDKNKAKKEQHLKDVEWNINHYSEKNFKKLPKWQQNIHKKAFVTNKNDLYYHELETLRYLDEGKEREVKIPKGDILDQFRKDVQNGELPSISWLVAPANFSDHPGAPWYGAWYVSEVLDILTQNPEIWKKTIFILTYDESDGYFDHFQPFTAPNPEDPYSGKCSSGIDSTVDFVTEFQAQSFKGTSRDPHRVSPIGLGYRVPFIVASPWTRGGWVNSQVFDHTSVLMFLEEFVSKSLNKTVEESNISPWRRMICGNLTSIFRTYHGESIHLPDFLEREPLVESIYNARFKKLPKGYRELTRYEIDNIRSNPLHSSLLPKQERGIRSACALPYQFYISDNIDINERLFELKMEVDEKFAVDHAVGAPFTVYDLLDFSVRNYAVKKGDILVDVWNTQGDYHYELVGPNGFFRSFKGNDQEFPVIIHCDYEKQRLNKLRNSGNLILYFELTNGDSPRSLEIVDNAYGKKKIHFQLGNKRKSLHLDLKRSLGWYDFTVSIENSTYSRRLAGHVETGEASYTDPYMGRMEI